MLGLVLVSAMSAGCKADIDDPCTSADDCEFGLVCATKAEAGRTVCQLPSKDADMRSSQPSDMDPTDGKQ